MQQFKSPPYVPVFYVQNIKMCIHSQRVRISTFSKILLVLIRLMIRFKMGTVSDLSLKSQDLQGPGGIMCDHLLILNNYSEDRNALFKYNVAGASWYNKFIRWKWMSNWINQWAIHVISLVLLDWEKSLSSCLAVGSLNPNHNPWVSPLLAHFLSSRY